jgi:hypothetical protein
MFFVFDLDGTISDATHRLYHLQVKPKDWASFYAGCINDAAIEPTIAVMRALVAVGHRVEIWTGRSDETEQMTRTWLHRYDVPDVRLRMRKAGDHRPDVEVKVEWLSLDDRPDMVFEDRSSMVEMWRALEIRVAQVAPGDF